MGYGHQNKFGTLWDVRGRPETPACRQARMGDEGACSEHRTRNLRYSEHNDREQRSLSPEGPGPKVFGGNVWYACFPKCFRVVNNVVKYNGKTNPSVWLEDYRLTCREGGVEDGLFIIQFLPVYLANTTRAWLDHLLRNCHTRFLRPKPDAHRMYAHDQVVIHTVRM
jgi:hypothetical protein